MLCVLLVLRGELLYEWVLRWEILVLWLLILIYCQVLSWRALFDRTWRVCSFCLSLPLQSLKILLWDLHILSLRILLQRQDPSLLLNRSLLRLCSSCRRFCLLRLLYLSRCARQVRHEHYVVFLRAPASSFSVDFSVICLWRLLFTIGDDCTCISLWSNWLLDLLIFWLAVLSWFARRLITS